MDTGTTLAQYLSPPSNSLKDKTKELEKTINDIRKTPTSEIGKTLWDKVIKPKLLTNRQIIKKLIILQSQSYKVPIEEDRAQLIVYGKIYNRKPELPTDTILTLWDNDERDPNCLSKPEDEDYSPPIDENSPMWEDIQKKKDELEKSIQEIGVKLGEMIVAQPTAIMEISSSLISMASSLVIMPPGSGLPVAFSALQTMMNSIRKLQSKTGEVLPYLKPLEYLSLVLPSSAQAIVASVTAIVTLYITSLSLIGKIVEALNSLINKLGPSATTQPTQELTIQPEASASQILKGDSVTLKANAKGGSWNFKYTWTEYINQSITGNEIPANKTPDDGQRIVKPLYKTEYILEIVDEITGERKTSDPIYIDIIGSF